MILFFTFLFFLIGQLSFFYTWFLLLLDIPLLFYLYFFRKLKWRSFFFLFLTLLGILILFLFPKGDLSATEVTGWIFRRRENYAFVLSKSGIYYVQDKGTLGNLFSYVSLTGYVNELSFSHYESGFDFKGYLHSQGVFMQFCMTDREVLFESPWSTQGMEAYAFQYLSEDAKSISSSLLFAESLSLSSLSLLGELGLTSLFSISGFHVSFLLHLPELFVKPKNQKTFSWIRLALAWGFLFLSSFRYAMIRFVLTSLFSLISLYTKKGWSSLSRLSLCALILLILFPYSLKSSAFYYAFPLLFYLHLLPKGKRGRPKRFFPVLLFLFFFPYRLYSQSGFSFLFILLQMILLPYSHLMFLLSLLLFVFPPLGVVLNLLSLGLIQLCSLSGSLHVYLVTGTPSIIYMVFFYLIFLLLPLAKTYGYFKTTKTLALSLAIVSASLFFPDVLPHAEIDFIDVDQGAATLVRSGYTNFLIDTGGKKNVDLASECLIPYFRKKKIQKLDAVIITHSDYDHSGALESLKANFPIDAVYSAEDFLSKENNSISIGKVAVENLNDYSWGEDTNSQSGVYRFDIQKTKILITGDAPQAIEKKLVEDKKDIDVDILALGHHGSKTSSSESFLSACSPSLCVISCGENNSYGFPHKETLSTLKKLNLAYRRTDEESTIEIKL